MKAKAKAKKPALSFSVHPMVQKVFIVIVFANFFAGVTQICYWIARQFPENQNLSAFLTIAISQILMPLLLYGLAYTMLPRTDSRLTNIFRAALLGTLGLMVAGILNQLSVLVYQNFVTFGSGYWEFVVYDLAAQMALLILFPVGLTMLKKHIS